MTVTLRHRVRWFEGGDLMELTIGSFAKQVGTTVRTLRYYDQIGLLVPLRLNEKGQKLYTSTEWKTYQQIAVCKYLGMTLEEIKAQLKDRVMSGEELLSFQKEVIEKKQTELNETMKLITRVQRLYEEESTKGQVTDELTFSLLDAFRREKDQIQAFKQYFSSDKSVVSQLNKYDEPEVQQLMDKEGLQFCLNIHLAMQKGETPDSLYTKELVQCLVKRNPELKKMLGIVKDDAFIQRHSNLFNTYFPEELGDFMYTALTNYLHGEEE